ELGRARGLRPVRHQVRRPSRSPPHPDAGRLGRAPGAEGLPGPDQHEGEDVRADAAHRPGVRGEPAGGSRSGAERLRMAARDGARLAEKAFTTAIALHERMRANLGPTIVAAQALSDALRAGKKLLVFGNGGSASDAQHMSAELVGRFMKERAAMPAIALTVDTSILTAIANDYSYKQVFVRQIEALGQAGDVAMGISTSGESPNVLAGLKTARARGLKTIALTGRDGGAIGQAADIHVNVPDQNTARVQEVHRTLLHVMCEV